MTLHLERVQKPGNMAGETYSGCSIFGGLSHSSVKNTASRYAPEGSFQTYSSEIPETRVPTAGTERVRREGLFVRYNVI